MAFSVTYIIRAIDQFTPVTRRISQSARDLERGLQRFGRGMHEFGGSMSNLGRGMTAGLTIPILGLGTAAVAISANLESIETRFSSFLGSAKKGKEMLESLTHFAAVTPFRLEQVTTAGQKLLGFGFKAHQIIPALETLGDVAAGSGGDIGKLGRMFGLAREENRIMAAELNALGDNGIPIIRYLSKLFGVNADQVRRMGAEGKITYRDFLAAMVMMTQKGGIFFDQTSAQSKILKGLYSTLLDNVMLTLGTVGDEIVRALDLKTVLKNTTSQVAAFGEAYKEFAAQSPELSAALIKLALGITVLGPALMALGAAASLLGMGLAVLASPIFWIIVLIAAIGAVVVLIIHNWEDLTEKISNEVQMIGSLIAGLAKMFWNFLKWVGIAFLKFNPLSLFLQGLNWAIKKLTGVDIFFWFREKYENLKTWISNFSLFGDDAAKEARELAKELGPRGRGQRKAGGEPSTRIIPESTGKVIRGRGSRKDTTVTTVIETGKVVTAKFGRGQRSQGTIVGESQARAEPNAVSRAVDNASSVISGTVSGAISEVSNNFNEAVASVVDNLKSTHVWPSGAGRIEGGRYTEFMTNNMANVSKLVSRKLLRESALHKPDITTPLRAPGETSTINIRLNDPGNYVENIESTGVMPVKLTGTNMR